VKQAGSHGKESARNNRGIVGNGVFCAVRAEMLQPERFEATS
jgi:hypothetical protein